MPYKVLIADDDKNLLNSLTIRLKAEGYEVISAEDSYFAVSHASKIRPDVMILDINMPAGDGFTVQQRIERLPHVPDIPVIYVTGDRSERVTRLAESQRAFAVIYKPFDTNQLLDTVREAAESRQPAAA